MLLDGAFAVAPHAGVVVELGDQWKMDAVARKRFRSEPAGLGTFGVAYFRDIEAEPGADDHYYQLGFAYGEEGGDSVRLAAVHRRIGDTLRVFFTDDFFDQVESVYLVRGDDLPELQFALSQKLAPKILATLQTNLGSGGGGVLLTADSEPFENQVRLRGDVGRHPLPADVDRLLRRRAPGRAAARSDVGRPSAAPRPTSTRSSSRSPRSSTTSSTSAPNGPSCSTSSCPGATSPTAASSPTTSTAASPAA